MKRPGNVVVIQFPFADLGQTKLRPALLLGKLPGIYDDWLICMVSSQTQRCVPDFDEIVREGDADYAESGLKVASLIRLGRLAVVHGEILMGAIGRISPERLQRAKEHLAKWLLQ